jgi:4-diphosphocytidyl-2-C-methyl-D-erythritol kinase
MVSFPPCKINLGLNVISKRPDGFHDITTCFYPVPWNDVLEVVPSARFSFAASGDPVPGAAADNLCVRAYEMLQKDFRLKPVAIHLHKVVPIGSGLGGGSSDGAHTLRLLNDIFGLSLTDTQLQEYAARLGSDCAFFIRDKPMLGQGRGEILSDINLSLKGTWVVIVKPEVHISTAEAFAGIKPKSPAADLRATLERHPVTAWKNMLHNDFEDLLFAKFPVMDALKKKLYAFGADYASLSGSGSAVFGLFKTEPNLQKEFESVTYWTGVLN